MAGFTTFLIALIAFGLPKSVLTESETDSPTGYLLRCNPLPANLPPCFLTHYPQSNTTSTPRTTTSTPCNCQPPGESGEITPYTLQAIQDVWLEGSGNLNWNFIIIAKHPGFAKKRILIQFANVPQEGCQRVLEAKMYMYFYGTSIFASPQSQDIARRFLVHQMKREWKEGEATSAQPKTGSRWNNPYVAIDDVDAASTPTRSAITVLPTQTGSYVEFDITSAAQNWKDGDPNYGLLIWATNEDVDGTDFRFYSREAASNKPYMRVKCVN